MTQTILIPQSVYQTAQNHPDKHIQDIAKGLVDLANSVARHQYGPDPPHDQVRSSAHFAQDVANDIVPPKDHDWEKLERIRNVIEAWEKAAHSRQSGLGIQWYQLAELIRIIDE